MDETQPLLAALKGEVSSTTTVAPDVDVDYDLVNFDPKDDPDDPLQWPRRYKWGIVVLLAFMAFTVTFTCVGLVPVADQIVRDLEGNTQKSASVLLVTIWELGEAAGPLIMAPLSEIYGRYIVFNVANVGFIAGVVLAALSPSASVLVFARFLTGCAVASNVLSPAIVADLFEPESRGSGMSAVFLAPLLAGAIAPTIASAIAETMGWRSILWMALVLAIVAELAFLTLFRETYRVCILKRRASRMRLETGNDKLRTIYDTEDDGTTAALWKSIARPVQVLWSSPILQALSLWGGVGFAFFYIMSTTLPEIVRDVYGLTPVLTGSVFMAFSFGSIIGLGACNLLVDRLYIKILATQDKKVFPEGRLPLCIVGGFALPLVILLYGFSAGQSWPLWLYIISIGLLGTAILVAEVPMMTYVTDAFGIYSASALTAVLIVRCLMGTFLPLVTAPLDERLGYGLGFTVLAGAALFLAPAPPLIMRYGGRWRQRCKFTADLTEALY